MKYFPLKKIAGLLPLLPLAVFGQVTSTFNYDNVNLDIPDRGEPDSASGVVNNQTVSGVNGAITSVQVSLDIVAATDINGQTFANNGDFYVSLVHTVGSTQEGFSVLLNRSGVSSSNPGGYADNGFDITLSDTAAYDVHSYQNTAYSLNGNGQLTGTWQPDGENIDPESDPSAFNNALNNQTAMLGSFDGFGADGTWSLFLLDAQSGGAGELSTWSLSIVTAPEPQPAGLLTMGLILWGRFRLAKGHGGLYSSVIQCFRWQKKGIKGSVQFCPRP